MTNPIIQGDCCNVKGGAKESVSWESATFPRGCAGGRLMPTSRNDTRVLCPFYQYDESKNRYKGYRIVCEGLIKKSALHHIYEEKADYLIQLNTFCCEHFDRCEIYRMLMDTKYSSE